MPPVDENGGGPPGGAAPPKTLTLLRTVLDLFAADGISDEDVAALTPVLEEVLGRRAVPDRTAYTSAVRTAVAAGRPGESGARHPLVVGTTGVYPRLDLRYEGATVTAGAQFGAAYEGAPGLVHGAFVAAGFDIVVSLAAARIDPWSMTRRLAIRFLRPTRLHESLTFTGTAVATGGRGIDVTARLADVDGRTTATAVSECVTFEPERFADRTVRASG